MCFLNTTRFQPMLYSVVATRHELQIALFSRTQQNVITQRTQP